MRCTRLSPHRFRTWPVPTELSEPWPASAIPIARHSALNLSMFEEAAQ